MKSAGALSLLLIITGLVWEQDQEKKDKDPPKPNPEKKDPAKPTVSRVETKKYHFKEAGKDMEYALFVPTSYNKDKKTPLVVALHGLLATPQIMMRYPGLTDQAEKHGFIVVAPMGYNTSGWYGAKPPKFGGKTKPENLGELSEMDVMNVLALIRKDFNIDSNRIYLMGHSMGGGGTFHIAMKHPDIWAAIAPISPATFRAPDGLDKIKHIPVLVIQGDKDSLVPVAGVRRWVEAMKKLEMTLDYLEVPGGGHIDVAFQNMPRVFEFLAKHAKKSKE